MADFFDKMKDGFNKSVATVSTGSKNMIEKTKLNSMIKTLEDEKKQLLEILGNKVYSFCAKSAEGDIPRDITSSICDEIEKRIQQIDLQKKKIAELDAEMSRVTGSSANNLTAYCNCGHANNPGAKFCAKCGAKIM